MTDLADTIRARVSDRLHWLELTPITAATQAGLPRDTIRNLFRRDAALPRADSLKSIASALKTSVAFLVGETVNPGIEKWVEERDLEEAIKSARPIPVRAGLSDVIRKYEDQPLEYIDLNVEGFATSDLSAFIVEDDAMDEFYEVGRYIVVAPLEQAGLQHGDHVVCIRILDKSDSPDLQTFVREFSLIGDGPALISRSRSAPREPISMAARGPHEMRFGGTVVADYRPRKSQAMPTSIEWDLVQKGGKKTT